MCGRFTLEPTARFYERFKIANRLDSLIPRFNIAPGQTVPVIIQKSPNRAVLMRWGLVPHWARDPMVGYKMINARAETLAEKPTFRGLLRSRRCLVPASGFYEWRKMSETKKYPYYIYVRGEPLFAFAGLYDTAKDAKGKELYTFTIITTSPNSLMAQVHDRMPVILDRKDEDAWLDKTLTDEQSTLELLQPYRGDEMELYPVSNLVNKPQNDFPALIQRRARLVA